MIVDQPASPASGASSLYSGAVWATLNAGFSVAFPLLLFVFFARVAPPPQLGVAAAALAALELVKAFGPQGLYEALLQGGARPEQDRAAVGLLLAAGTAGTVLFAAAALAVAEVWRDLGAMRWAVVGLAPKVLFDFLVLQPQATLARRAAFRPLAARTMVANLLAAAIGIGVALNLRPIWGLIAAYVAQSALLFLLTAAWSRALARPTWAPAALRTLAPQAALASAVRLAGAANSYLDQLLLALFVPAIGLARFNLGKRIEATLVTAQAAFSGVLFQPAFAAVDPRRRAQVIGRGRALLTAACGVPVAVFAANPEPLVAAVFGPRWAPAAAPAALLAIGGLARLYGGVHGALLSVSGRNGALLAYALGSAAVGAAALVIAAPFGLTAVAAALAAKNLIALAAAAVLTRADAPRPILTLLHDAVGPTLAAWLAAVAAGETARRFGAGEIGAVAASAAAGVAVGLWSVRTGLADLIRERRLPVGDPAPCR